MRFPARSGAWCGIWSGEARTETPGRRTWCKATPRGRPGAHFMLTALDSRRWVGRRVKATS
jgi:hypothetical protein